jgi:hypothetical protein
MSYSKNKEFLKQKKKKRKKRWHNSIVIDSMFLKASTVTGEIRMHYYLEIYLQTSVLLRAEVTHDYVIKIEITMSCLSGPENHVRS